LHCWKAERVRPNEPLLGSVHVHSTKLIGLVGLVWFGLVWFGLVWFGLVWFGLVWFGLVWFGLVWFGLVCLVWFGWFGWFGFIPTRFQLRSAQLCPK
jgi:hypothetical protein